MRERERERGAGIAYLKIEKKEMKVFLEKLVFSIIKPDLSRCNLA